MSRMTEALAKQAKLNELTGEEFKNAADKAGIAAISELNPAHYAVIESLLENPRISSSDLGAMHGYSSAYIAKLRRTPIFIIQYEATVEDVHKQFRQSLVAKVAETTSDALLAMSEILKAPLGDEVVAGMGCGVTAKEKTAVAKLLFEGDAFSLFKGATLNQQQPAALSVNVNTSPSQALGVTNDMLKNANSAMANKFSNKEDIIDGEISTDSVKE